MASARRDRIALSTALAAAGVVITLAIFNVSGWAVTWDNSFELKLLFCGIAFFSEFLAFLLAVSIERQWKDHRPRAIACLYALLVCAAVNLVSGHNAWVEFEGRMVAADTLAEQARIDRERGQMLDVLAAIDAELAAARPSVDSALGPQNRAEARELYQIEVQRLSPRRDQVQRRLDALPLVAEERHIIEPWAVWVAFALLELMKAVVLWGVGIGFAQVGALVKQAGAAAALSAQEPKPAPEMIERPALRDDPPERKEPVLVAQELLEKEFGGLKGRALLDVLEQNNVINMRDVSSKHASRPRPGRRKNIEEMQRAS
jgi:hypothetical protein